MSMENGMLLLLSAQVKNLLSKLNSLHTHIHETLGNLFLSSTAIMCPDLSEPDNGFVTFAVDTSSPYDYLTMATYGCNTDYGLSSGENVRTCVLSSIGGGEWSGNAPSCEGVQKLMIIATYSNYNYVNSICTAITCQLLTPVTNGGAITYSPDMTIPFAIRTVATYSCLQGFRLEGSPDRTCVGDGSTSDGTWDSVEPVCNGMSLQI